MSVTQKAIEIRGVVQGVGFRPFVFRLARDRGLAGWVRNTSSGVEIAVEGSEEALEGFIGALVDEAPPLARIESITATSEPPNGYEGFEIRDSSRQAGQYQLVSPDIATCPECLREIVDSEDRRNRYPFTNCTNCGPRFTIIADIPYDRSDTTMKGFAMCPECQREYDNPLDRRFHAQPNACPVCGPHVWLTDVAGEPMGIASEDAIAEAAILLREGAILAIKGLGGFHLACDATDGDAVARLRERKRRPSKPMAVMMVSVGDIRDHCEASPAEEEQLTSPMCPVVLLRWKSAGGWGTGGAESEKPIVRRERPGDIHPSVAPGNRYLGVMLPYTPLHHILMRDVGRPLVMTSGNLSEEPIAQDNGEALRRLAQLADYFLLHNRDIYARYDDSVWFVPKTNGQMKGDTLVAPGGEPRQEAARQSYAQPIRRSRGFAPYPIKLPHRVGRILACGAELKNTFCITRDENAFMSQHIGDMENLETLEHFERSVELFQRLFRIRPEIVAHDRHPDYLSTRYALRRRGEDPSIRHTVEIQHHEAHIASCLADNGWTNDGGPVIGVAFDGTGYGTDGHIWGGELLVGDYRGFRRAGHLEYLPMAGGERAIRNPYRLTLGYLYRLLGSVPGEVAARYGAPEELGLIQQQIERELNAPVTSACGRLFDAVSALLGVCARTSYEAQAAIELEMAATEHDGPSAPYGFEIQRHDGTYVIRLRQLFEGLLADVRDRADIPRMAHRFHSTVVRMIVEANVAIANETGISTVALSGGCFQNRLLLRLTVPALCENGFDVLLHRQVPCNDGGLSLGQAVLAGYANLETEKPKTTE